MKRMFFTIMPIILLAIFVNGCIICAETSYGDSWRTYNHSASKNVTINIYKTELDNLTVLESNLNNMQVKVNLFYEVRTWVKNDTGGQQLIEDYVKFYGNDDNLIINISLSRTSDEDFSSHKAYANVFVYLPPGTNYSINYVGYSQIRGL